MNKIKLNKATRALSAFFKAEGKIYSEEDYLALGSSQPVAGTTIRRIFGGYRGAILGLKRSKYWSSIKDLDGFSQYEPAPSVPEAEAAAAAAAAPKITAPVKPLEGKPAEVKVEK
jgi:hypothetical protein